MITDASIAAALLWSELAEFASLQGAAAYLQPHSIGRHWTITADPLAQTVAVAWDGQPAGIIGPGETCDFTGAPPDATPQRLRRDLHEHVYQLRRRANTT
jgi:hypothetical protein